MALGARLVASGVCLLNVVGLLGVGIALRRTNLFELLYETIPPGLQALLLLPLLCLPLSLALPWFAWRGFAAGEKVPLARLHYWGLTAGALLTLVLAQFWNLLGFNY